MNIHLRYLVLATLSLVSVLALSAESDDRTTEKKHSIVFHVDMDGVEKWKGVLGNVENVFKEFGTEKTRIVVVTHSKGLGLLLSKNYGDNPELEEKLEKLHASGVVFAACENTMKRENVQKEDLFEHATTVPSGVAEVILKQEEGYSYIKPGG